MVWILMGLATVSANRAELADEWRLTVARVQLEGRRHALSRDAYLDERLRLAGRTEVQEVLDGIDRRAKVLEDRHQQAVEKARKAGLLPPKPPDVK